MNHIDGASDDDDDNEMTMLEQQCSMYSKRSMY